MTYLICYDITDNKERNKVSKFLEKYGIRIQRSVFIIDVNSNQYNDIEYNLLNFISNNDSIFIIKLCKACLDGSKFIGNKVDSTIVV
jgi:CRISPR-associated protein Cas2